LGVAKIQDFGTLHRGRAKMAADPDAGTADRLVRGWLTGSTVDQVARPRSWDLC